MSLAIVGGTSLMASLLNARGRLLHAKAALLFSVTGIVGALGGAQLTHLVSAPVLMLLFAALMLAVAVLMLRGRADLEPDPATHCRWHICAGDRAGRWRSDRISRRWRWLSDCACAGSLRPSAAEARHCHVPRRDRREFLRGTRRSSPSGPFRLESDGDVPRCGADRNGGRQKFLGSPRNSPPPARLRLVRPCRGHLRRREEPGRLFLIPAINPSPYENHPLERTMGDTARLGRNDRAGEGAGESGDALRVARSFHYPGRALLRALPFSDSRDRSGRLAAEDRRRGRAAR